MVTKLRLSPQALVKLRRRAKKKRKELNISLSAAQDQVAREVGHASWREMVTPLGRPGGGLHIEARQWSDVKQSLALQFSDVSGLASRLGKASDSTMFYDRYDEWTALLTDSGNKGRWFLGEYVERRGYRFSDSFDAFSMAFTGQSGSGKTEAMRTWLTAFLCVQPSSRLILCDLKMTGDWDVFGPLCEGGSVVKSVEEATKAILYAGQLLAERKLYMEKMGYKNIKAWSMAENIDVPEILLVIDEFPALNHQLLDYGELWRVDDTAANVLYKLVTQGRSFGLRFVIGSQWTGQDYIPSQLSKNIKLHVTMRTNSREESLDWIGSVAAYELGRGKFQKDGSHDGQYGHAYIGSEEEYVRFWYMDDWYIVHELRKYGVRSAEGVPVKQARVPSIPYDIKNSLKALGLAGRGEDGLSERDRERLRGHERGVESFSSTYKTLAPARASKVALGKLWLEEESAEDYASRLGRSLVHHQDRQED